MRSFRIVVLLFAFGAAAVAVAGIRAEQARSILRIQRLRLQELELLAELRSLELQIARLRSPGQIEGRIKRFELPVVRPGGAPQSG